MSYVHMRVGRRDVLAGLAAVSGAAVAGRVMAQPTEQRQLLRSVPSLHAEMRRLVGERKLAGVVTLLAQQGRILDLDACGRQDASLPTPMATDSIFRIASMTKPIIGAAMLQLREAGKWNLEDAVSVHIPEFANLKVKSAGGESVPMARPMTMAQLMSHNAGFGGLADYKDAQFQSGTLQEMITRLASMPLHDQPGSVWLYGPVVDIQGYLVEKFSGERLDHYLQRHIFDPLAMSDTQFWVPASKRPRVVQMHTYADGVIVPATWPQPPSAPPVFLSGSGGLFSTAMDYFRFAQCLLDEGKLDGVRILKPESVRLMHTNVLPSGVRVQVQGPQPDNGLGFGLDVATHDRPAVSGLPYGRGSFWWPGAFGTSMWVDPANRIVFVGLIQNINGGVPGSETPPVRTIWPRIVYSALESQT